MTSPAFVSQKVALVALQHCGSEAVVASAAGGGRGAGSRGGGQRRRAGTVRPGDQRLTLPAGLPGETGAGSRNELDSAGDPGGCKR